MISQLYPSDCLCAHKETLGQTRSVPELAALGIHFADEDLQKAETST